MADGTGIQWTDATWNPVRGCSRVSAGCDNCYAMRQAVRQNVPGGAYEGLTIVRPKGHARPGVDWSGSVRLAPDVLEKPLRWRKPRRIFVDSMSDLFHMGLANEEIAAVFGVMAACPQHTFQILTKRPERAADWFKWVEQQDEDPPWTLMLGNAASHLEGPLWSKRVEAMDLESPDAIGEPWPLPNVWLGVSVENQETADERIPKLLECPADVRFVSAEPLLGSLDLQRDRGWLAPFHETDAMLRRTPRIDWVIVGGESGNGARPFHIEWARTIVDQCMAAGVAPFVKQLGKNPFVSGPGLLDDDDPDAIDVCRLRLKDSHGGDWEEWPADLRMREFPTWEIAAQHLGTLRQKREKETHG